MFTKGILFFALILSPVPVSFAGSNDPLELVLTAPAETLTDGKPLQLTATLKNISHQDIVVTQIRGDVRAAYRFTVREVEHLRIVQKREDVDGKYPSTSERFDTITLKLRPGEQIQEVIKIGDFYDLRERATYVIQAERYTPDQQKMPYIVSNSIAIDVR